jgi:hypothetical protein
MFGRVLRLDRDQEKSTALVAMGSIGEAPRDDRIKGMNTGFRGSEG